MTVELAMTDDSEREFCGAVRRGRPPCGLPAGWGTEHPGIGACKLHAGSTPSANAAAARIRAERMSRVFGVPIDGTNPLEALADLLDAQQGIVAWLRLRVAELDEGEAYGPVGGGESSLPRFEPHVWIKMLGVESDRLRQVIKDALDWGLEAKRLQMAEDQGRQIAEKMRLFIGFMGMDPNDPAVMQAVRRALMAGAAGGDVVEGG